MTEDLFWLCINYNEPKERGSWDVNLWRLATDRGVESTRRHDPTIRGPQFADSPSHEEIRSPTCRQT